MTEDFKEKYKDANVNKLLLQESLAVGDTLSAKKWLCLIEIGEDIFYGDYTYLTLHKFHELNVELKGSQARTAHQ